MSKKDVFGTPKGREIPAYANDPMKVPHAGNGGVRVVGGPELAMSREEQNNRKTETE